MEGCRRHLRRFVWLALAGMLGLALAPSVSRALQAGAPAAAAHAEHAHHHHDDEHAGHAAPADDRPHRGHLDHCALCVVAQGAFTLSPPVPVALAGVAPAVRVAGAAHTGARPAEPWRHLPSRGPPTRLS